AARRVAALVSPKQNEENLAAVRGAAEALGVEVLPFYPEVPAVYPAAFAAMRSAGAQGCLLGYGPAIVELNGRNADNVARIFRGTAPGDLPIEQPTHFEFAINLKTAKALGLAVPPAILARADDVIE